jgi:hypothetical protein
MTPYDAFILFGPILFIGFALSVLATIDHINHQ